MRAGKKRIPRNNNIFNGTFDTLYRARFDSMEEWEVLMHFRSIAAAFHNFLSFTKICLPLAQVGQNADLPWPLMKCIKLGMKGFPHSNRFKTVWPKEHLRGGCVLCYLRAHSTRLVLRVQKGRERLYFCRK